MIGTTVFKKNKNMVTRKIADETILLPIYKTSKEINCIYTLNKPASIVWDMIDGKTTVGEIKDKVLNNGFDLIKDSAYRIKDSAGKKIKNKEEIVGEVLVPSRYKEGKAERERERGVQRDTQHVSRDARKEVDSQLKVFFGELKEIKAVVKDKGKRIKVKRDNVGAALASARNKKKGRKMKFLPEITRVKLNPEQAVLTCSCYSQGHKLAYRETSSRRFHSGSILCQDGRADSHDPGTFQETGGCIYHGDRHSSSS